MSKPCTFFAEGRCTKGAACKYAHDSGVAARPPPTTPTDRPPSPVKGKPCRDGAKCTNDNCPFIHADSSSAMTSPSSPLRPSSSETCHFGHNCTRSDCKFSHPEGRKIDAPCPFRSTCTKVGCKRLHSEPRLFDLLMKRVPAGISNETRGDLVAAVLDHIKLLGMAQAVVRGANLVGDEKEKAIFREQELRGQFSGCLLGLASTLKYSNVLGQEEVERRARRECFRLRARLPALALRERFIEVVKTNRCVVVKGETGSGKSTQLPAFLADSFRGKVICTQPRPLAAQNLALRVAFEFSGGQDGPTTSEWVRYWGERKKLSKEERHALEKSNRVTYMSESQLVGLLANERHNFASVAAIVIDEAHERTIYTDILLGLLRDPKPRWAHVKLVVTSATLETGIFCEFLGNAPLLSIPGRLFPVTIDYAPTALHDASAETIGITAAQELVSSEVGGDCLVFLPGKAEIGDAVAAAKGWLAANDVSVVDKDPSRDDGRSVCVQVLELFGQQEPEEQARVFLKASHSRKLIFSTNIAETSLTIDGVRLVIDSGKAKENTFDGRSGMSIVEECQISQSSATQRAGRAGRTAPGRCLRLYSSEMFEFMPAARAPDIFRNPLSQTLLLLAAFGFTAKQFAWVSRPPDESINAAETELGLLEALQWSTEGVPQLTRLGELIPRLMVEPRVAKMLLRGLELKQGPAACLLAAILPQHSNLIHRSKHGAQEEKGTFEIKVEPFLSKDGDLVTLFHMISSLQQTQGSLFARAKSLGLRAKPAQNVLTTALEMQRQLLKAGVWELPQEPVSAIDDDTLRSLATCALGKSMSCVQRGRWDRIMCVDSGVLGRISSRLPKDGAAPPFLLWTNCTQVDDNVYYSGWIRTSTQEMQASAPLFLNSLKDKLQNIPSCEIAAPPVSHAVARAVLAKWRGSEISKHWSLDYDANTGVLRLLVTHAEEQHVRGLLLAQVSATAAAIQMEIVEEPIPGGGVLVLGAGGCATHLLPPNSFLRIILSGMSGASVKRIDEGGLLQSVTGLPPYTSLQTQGDKVEIVFPDHVSASTALGLLNGEVVEGRTIRASAIRCGGNLSGRERASANLELTWALGVSRCKASIRFDNEVKMKECLQKAAQLAAVIGGGARVFPFKPKDGTTKEGQEKVRFQVNLAKLQPHMDEIYIEERLVGLGITGARVLLSRVTVDEQDETFLGLQLAELRDLIPLAHKVKSQTSFALDASLRAGLKIFYETMDDCEEALGLFREEKLPHRNGQPVRLQASFRYQISVHVKVFALRQKRFEEIAEVARGGGVSVTFKKGAKLQRKDATTLKEQDAINVNVSSSRNFGFLQNIMQRLRDAQAGVLWVEAGKDRMFSRAGRQMLEKFSGEDCHIHWVTATRSIWVYVAEGRPIESALQTLRDLSKSLDGLLLDVAIPMRRGGARPTRARLANLPYAEVSKNNRLLWVCAKEEDVEQLKAEFGAPVRNAGAGEAESCSICFCDLEDPITLSVCGHRFDSECLMMNINQPDLPLPIVCPRDGCRKNLAMRDIMALCGQNPEVLVLVKEKAMDGFLLKHGGGTEDGKPRRCPANDCVDVLFSNHCSSCQRSYCWNCTHVLGKGTAAHGGATCEEWRAGLTPGNMEHRRHIEEKLMTLHCPRCGQAFLDYNGCAALTCHKCACGFCACCLADCGGDAHGHLAAGCSLNPTGKNYFISEGQFKEIHRKRIQTDIVCYLNNNVKDPADRAAVILLIRKSLQDLGIDIE